MAEAGVPLFLSYKWCARARVQALVPWALDSGGYTQVTRLGRYETSAAEYAAGVQRLARDVGSLDFAVVQDWPGLPGALEATGLSLHEHQQRTVESYLELRTLAADVTWAPVLTGTTPADYARHAELHEHAGVQLDALPVVTVGALVGRPAPQQEAVIDGLGSLGLPLHGLGIKAFTLARTAPLLSSADSHGWSAYGRHEKRPLCAPEAAHKDCRNCLAWALLWAERTVARERSEQRQTALAL